MYSVFLLYIFIYIFIYIIYQLTWILLSGRVNLTLEFLFLKKVEVKLKSPILPISIRKMKTIFEYILKFNIGTVWKPVFERTEITEKIIVGNSIKFSNLYIKIEAVAIVVIVINKVEIAL